MSQWNKEVQNRRDAELQLKIAKKSLEYLQDKPDLPEFVESVKQLQKSTVETYALYKRMTELMDDVILRDAEERVEVVAKLLLEECNK